MDYSKLTKPELIAKCAELGITKCKSKSKQDLIKLIENAPETATTAPTNTDTPANEPASTSATNTETTPPGVTESNIEVHNIDGMNYMEMVEDNSIHLILTDPPYIISKETGMNSHYNTVKKNEENGVTVVKTEEEWEEYKAQNEIMDDDNKEKYMKYGTIYGKKYCVKTDYGEWDSEFTMEQLDQTIAKYYRTLVKGGTLIMFFDLWKITDLKNLLEKHKFKQIRFIEWIKTNPQPLNSRVNYLTNCREIALVAVKGGSPTFNSSYDNGIYHHPLQGGKNRFHPTQKSLSLFEELITKHSNPGDTVMDTFLGSGTTALACKNTHRHFKGCEISTEYYNRLVEIVGL